MIRPEEITAYLRGEGEADERAALREAMDRDLGLALEYAEQRETLEEARELAEHCGPTPSGRVRLALQLQCQRLRARRRAPALRQRVRDVVLVAAAVLCLLSVGRDLLYQGSPQRTLRFSGRTPLAAGERAESESVRQDSLPIEFAAFISADNELRRLRAEVGLGRDVAARQRALAPLGGGPVQQRLEALAQSIADQVRGPFDRADAGETAALSLALRALISQGHSASAGRHHREVAALGRELSERLTTATGGELAVLLAGLSALGVTEGGAFDDRLARHGDRLATQVLARSRTRGAARPLFAGAYGDLAFADAGRVLQLAPAFGADPALCFRARLRASELLAERLASPHREQPGLRAAQAFAYGDLVDRSSADRALLLWRPELLLPNYVALYHLSWSRLPARAGWSQFQRSMRGLAASGTPPALQDRAALLLSLSGNFAAPGALELYEQVGMR